MLPGHDQGLIVRGIEDTERWKRSPFVQGFLAAAKGGLVGAGAGTLINAVRGASPVAGALVGGLGVGLLSGAAKAISQDIENVDQESAMRYYLMRLKEREPMVYMPPPSDFGHVFTRFHDWAHRKAALLGRQ